MTTIAEKLDSILNTKDAIRHVIEDNDGYVPDAFSEYPSTIDDMLSDVFLLLLLNDTMIIRNDTKATDLNRLISKLPQSGKTTTEGSKPTATITAAQLNVRAEGNGSANYLGLLVKGDIVNVYGTASSGWYKINQWRENGTSGPVVTHSTYGYISNNTAYVSYDPGKSTITISRKINVTAMVGTEQLKVDYKQAELKGWEVIFDPKYNPKDHDTSGGETGGGGSGGGSGSGSAGSTVKQTVTYSFDNCYTDNYQTQSYTSKIGTAPNTIRQGHWDGWYYYKGNIRFSASKLTEVKNILNNTKVSKVELYMERANTNNGLNAASYMSVYLCDSKGANADVVVNNTSTLKRGASIWLTLTDTVISGLKNGKYDHFKTYASTDQSHYIVYSANPKLRITYTAE